MDTQAERGVLLVTRFDDADLLRRALAHSADGESPSTPDCLDEHTIAALAEGSVSAESRSAVLPHVAACERCRGAVASVARALADPDVAAEIRAAAAIGPTRMTRIARIALPLAAAAALLVIVLPGSDNGGPPLHRAPASVSAPASNPAARESSVGAYRDRTLTTTAAPRILGPIGTATLADSLRWSSVPGADLYRLTFWRRDGAVAWAGEVRDTVLSIPPELARSGEEYLLWDVKARTGWDRWVVSDLAELTLSPQGGMPR